ncbi:MAG TPA: 50S ribosomal protein L11 methyltransferase [Solirubrobacteraceae bacterium]
MPCGSFADLGCGTGVLAILAAKLGWSPVLAVDLDDHSVDATLANAALNDVAVRVTAADVTRDPVPVADGIAANVPTAVHLSLAARLPERLPQVALLSGFAPDAADEILAAYAARGLHERRRIDAHAWTVALMAR